MIITLNNYIYKTHKKNTLTRDINRLKQKKNCQIITGGVTGLKEIVKKVQQGNEQGNNKWYYKLCKN